MKAFGGRCWEESGRLSCEAWFGVEAQELVSSMAKLPASDNLFEDTVGVFVDVGMDLLYFNYSYLMGRVTRIHGGGVLISKRFSSVCTLDPSQKEKFGGAMPFFGDYHGN